LRSLYPSGYNCGPCGVAHRDWGAPANLSLHPLSLMKESTACIGLAQ
jgi:hypothetical protein